MMATILSVGVTGILMVGLGLLIDRLLTRREQRRGPSTTVK